MEAQALPTVFIVAGRPKLSSAAVMLAKLHRAGELWRSGCRKRRTRRCAISDPGAGDGGPQPAAPRYRRADLSHSVERLPLASIFQLARRGTSSGGGDLATYINRKCPKTLETVLGRSYPKLRHQKKLSGSTGCYALPPS